MRDYCKKSNRFVWVVLAAVFTLGCKAPQPELKYEKIAGETWGTYYQVTLAHDGTLALKDSITQILKDFDSAVSTYVEDSHISTFNKSEKGLTIDQQQDRYFAPVFRRSIELLATTDGYLDASVMPLLNYWGFGYKPGRKITAVDSSEVMALKQLTRLASIIRTDQEGQVSYQKTVPGVEIDFSAIAKGYGIDVIAQFLTDKGIKNYLIDIGGEARAMGLNEAGKSWTLAINKPSPDAAFTTQELIISLINASIATSGNYREMIELDGKQYGHIINPKTGFPGTSDVLSATIIAPDCMTADGLATACVAAGMEKAKEILARHTRVSACLIYDANGDDNLEKHYVGGFEKFVLVEN